MCHGCWEEWGSPQIDTPKVREAAAAIHDVYTQPHGGVGGGLHVQLDDFNIDDQYWDAESRKDIETYGHPAEWDIQRRCFDLMRALTEEERASALSLNDGYWEISAGGASAPPAPTPERG